MSKVQSREAAKVFTEMLTLFNRFAVVHAANYPDQQTGLIVYWTNPRAEERYGMLQREYDKLTGGSKDEPHRK